MSKKLYGRIEYDRSIEYDKIHQDPARIWVKSESIPYRRESLPMVPREKD